MHSTCGFSLYLSTPLKQNLNLIQRFSDAGFRFVFTSLNISEESHDMDVMTNLLALCRHHQLYVIVDINKTSLKSFGITGLKKIGVQAVRLDDGVSNQDLVMLSQHFDIVLNASTLTDDFLEELTLQYGIDSKKLIACHNYYPKEYTGISLESFKDKNELCQRYKIKTIGFVAGEEKRFPMYQGLPTIENHRNKRSLYAALECMVVGKCHAICIGDIDVSDETLRDFKYLADNIVPLRARIDNQYKTIVFENRVDASEYVIRAAFSRTQLQGMKHSGECISRKIGDICISNEKYGRYQNELEICLIDLPEDERQSVIGRLCDEDLELLPLIKQPFKFEFI